MTSSSPIPHITDETRAERAAALILRGYGVEDVAASIYGKSDGFTLSAARQLVQSDEVRKLVEHGRAKALGAH
jgi:hypothetical protein